MYDRGYEVMHTTSGGPELILMLAFWVLVVVGAIFLVKYLVGMRPASNSTAPKALEILEERFARGEIDAKEYTEKRNVLTGANAKLDAK